MQIATESQHRLLAFVDACNRNHYEPSAEEVTAWAHSPRPYEARYTSLYGGAQILSSLLPAFDFLRGQLEEDAEGPVDHLLRIGWLDGGLDDSGIVLTALGRALLRAANSDAQAEEDVRVVVLGRDDPLAYPQLIGLLTKAGAGMLIDPYLRLDQLHHLVSQTDLTRLLTSGRPSRREDLAAMAIYLNSASTRRVEVRHSDDLHDRLVIHADSSVDILGASLNGVGRHTTVYTPTLASAASALTKEYEAIWRKAKPLSLDATHRLAAETKTRRPRISAKKASAALAPVPLADSE